MRLSTRVQVVETTILEHAVLRKLMKLPKRKGGFKTVELLPSGNLKIVYESDRWKRVFIHQTN